MLAYHGIDVGAVLRHAGLPEDLLARRTVTMTEPQYYRFLDAIGEVAGFDGPAVSLASTDRIEQFSPPIFAAFCSRNARLCIERLARYKRLIGPMCMRASEQDGELCVEYLPGDPRLQLSGFLVATEFAFLLSIIRRATRKDIVPVRMIVTSEATDPALERFAGIPALPGDGNRIVFRSEDMELPFISFDDGMWNYFEPELERRLADMDIDASMSARVRAALSESLPAGVSDIEEIAERMGLTTRTLQRRLAEEHTTFRKQLNNTREVLALHYIRNTDLSTGDIAFLLGYAELNSFLRAFAVWTGKSISEFRQAECGL